MFSWEKYKKNLNFQMNESLIQCSKYRLLVQIEFQPNFFQAFNLGFLAPSRTIFHGRQIVHWDPLNGKQTCPQKFFGMGYVKMHGFHGNPLYDSREWVVGLQNSILSRVLLILER